MDSRFEKKKKDSADEGEPFFHQPLVIVPRAEWDADPPKATKPMVHPVHKVVFTFDTDMPVCMNKEDCITAMLVLQGKHMKLEGKDDIKYNFLVGGDGLVYEGRGFNYQPCESLEYPEHHGDRLDIAFIGMYKSYDEVPEKLRLPAYDTAQKGIDDGYVAEFYEYYEAQPPPSPPENPKLEETIEEHVRKAPEGISFAPINPPETPV